MRKGDKINIKKKKEKRSISRRQLWSRDGWGLGDLSSGSRAL